MEKALSKCITLPFFLIGPMENGTRALLIFRYSYFQIRFIGMMFSLVRENQSRTHTQIAKRIRNHLSSTYPGSSWVVTVYDDVTGFNKHTVLGYNYFHRFRYYGVNIDVTRFPHYGLRSPSPTISTIVGSITGSNAETAVYTIRDRFNTNNETFTTIHAVRKSSLNDQGLVTASYIADSNYFWREFSNVIVIVVAPRYF